MLNFQKADSPYIFSFLRFTDKFHQLGQIVMNYLRIIGDKK